MWKLFAPCESGSPLALFHRPSNVSDNCRFQEYFNFLRIYSDSLYVRFSLLGLDPSSAPVRSSPQTRALHHTQLPVNRNSEGVICITYGLLLKCLSNYTFGPGYFPLHCTTRRRNGNLLSCFCFDLIVNEYVLCTRGKVP